jgi:hypothetical protein
MAFTKTGGGFQDWLGKEKSVNVLILDRTVYTRLGSVGVLFLSSPSPSLTISIISYYTFYIKQPLVALMKTGWGRNPVIKSSRK